MTGDFADKRIDLAREPDFALGEIQVRPSTRQIESGGSSETLEPRVMQVLVFLARHAGEVVSRDDLIRTCWEGRVVGEDALNRCISKVRKLQEATGAFQLETIPRVGYRLTAQTAPAAQQAPAAPEQPAPIRQQPAEQQPAGQQALPPARKLDLRLIAGLAAAALAIVVIAVFALRPQASAHKASPANHLIAFFEFTPAGDDPALTATAEIATDRMFQAMRRNFLVAVARTETRNTPEDKRFARAAELGARYVLGGEVRHDTDGATLAIRFEDVSSRLTLWERSISSPASDVAYLPAQAALEAAEAMWCMIKTRSELTRDTDEILNLIADRCREGGGASTLTFAYMAARMRAVAEADPDSAFNQAQLVMMLGLGVSSAPEATQAAWIAESEAALQRAVRLDPEETGVYLARITLAQGKRVPMAEWDAIIQEAVEKSEGKDNFVFGQANNFRFLVLRGAGRFREALPHEVAAVANDPLSYPWYAALHRAVLGQTAEARAELEPQLAAYGAWLWDPLISYAIFFDAADADAMLKSPPSAIPKPTVDCMRDIRSALAAKAPGPRALGAKKARACAEAKSAGAMAVLASLAALDDLDGAFDLAGRQTFDAPSLWNGALQVLFWPTSQSMRADPRFLPLVEKLGLMDYWRATKSQPDLCETEAAPFCAALKSANGKP